LEPEKVRRDEPLAKHTTLGIGGKADIFYTTETSGDLVKAVRLAHTFKVPVTVIGGGSNILVADAGIRGLVIRNKSKKIIVHKEGKIHALWRGVIGARWKGSAKGTKKYDFSDLDYDESKMPDVEVILDSGVNLQVAMAQLFEQGVTGLQWYSRIPGTIGGAIYNNIHGGTHTFSEVVKKVAVLDEHGGIKTLAGKNLKLGYDSSRFQNSEEIILEVTLTLKMGDVERARKVADEWKKRKSSQSMNSAGCVFKNISEGDREILGYPTTSVGYIVEHVLNMTGYKVGGASISKEHHNFIVNSGKATAKDYLAVRDEIARRARESLGIELEDEIIRLGEFGGS
jgi:UDP-N-acetylmuramate dehydrogenase